LSLITLLELSGYDLTVYNFYYLLILFYLDTLKAMKATAPITTPIIQIAMITITGDPELLLLLLLLLLFS